MAIWLGILLMLVPFYVIMVLESRRVDHDEDDDELGGHEAGKGGGRGRARRIKRPASPLIVHRLHIERAREGYWNLSLS